MAGAPSAVLVKRMLSSTSAFLRPGGPTEPIEKVPQVQALMSWLKQSEDSFQDYPCRTIGGLEMKLVNVSVMSLDVDLSLAPTPAVGVQLPTCPRSTWGLKVVGTRGTAAALTLLNDQVKKRWHYGLQHKSVVLNQVLSFQVSEDEGMITQQFSPESHSKPGKWSPWRPIFSCRESA